MAAGGSLRSSLSGSRPTSHSQGHGRPCLPRPHLRRDFLKQRNLTDVSSRNLVQFGFSVVLHLDIFLVIGIIELVQHILTYVEIEALSSQLLPEFGRFSSLRVRGCGPPLIWSHKLALRSVFSWIIIFSASTPNYSHSRIFPNFLARYSVYSRSN